MLSSNSINQPDSLSDKVIRNVRGCLKYPHAMSQIFTARSRSNMQHTSNYSIADVCQNIEAFVAQNEGRIQNIRVTPMAKAQKGYLSVKVVGEIFGQATSFQVELLTPSGSRAFKHQLARACI